MQIFTDIKKFAGAKLEEINSDIFNKASFKIAAVGRFLDKEKNFSMLIKAMKSLAKIDPKIVLLLIGYGPDEIKYKKLVSEYDLEKNVVIIKTDDNLAGLLKNCDMFVLSSNYEGWGRVVIEAMASGLPVVMTDVGLAGEVVRDRENGLVVPVADKKALVKALQSLYVEKELREKLAKRGQQEVLNLSPQTEEEYFDRHKKTLEVCIKSK